MITPKYGWIQFLVSNGNFKGTYLHVSSWFIHLKPRLITSFSASLPHLLEPPIRPGFWKTPETLVDKVAHHAVSGWKKNDRSHIEAVILRNCKTFIVLSKKYLRVTSSHDSFQNSGSSANFEGSQERFQINQLLIFRGRNPRLQSDPCWI